MTDRIFVGIDIGWSRTRRLCGVATCGGSLALPRAVSYGSGVAATKVGIDELKSMLWRWSHEHAAEVARAVLVLDGPLAVGAPPSGDRAIDSGCGTGGFSGRAQPTPISHPSGEIFVRTTYAVVDALGPEARASIWVGGSLPDGLVLAETNPTVALAMVLPQQPVDTIPTRSRPRLFNERSVRAKSDWYWRLGGGTIVAEALGCPIAAKEMDHERVAALTCLALARQFAGGSLDGSDVLAVAGTGA